jgi:tRNA A-37 threonylcarbamoyl transferase component Bud32
MRINISGKGIHRREVAGVEKLRSLPSHWYAFTNLEFIQAGSLPRQIDLVIVLDDRLLIADLKDWHGKISSDGDRWFQNDRSVDTSPVKKILENTRILKSLLSGYLSKHALSSGVKFHPWEVPLVEGCVILTGRCDIRGIPDLEKPRVFQIDEFCRVIQDGAERNGKFAQVKWLDKADPYTAASSQWRSKLAAFFGSGSGYFRPLDKRYGDYRVVSDVTYGHPKHLYSEYDVEEVTASRAFGLLRLWDFSKADSRYASEEARAEIAGREQAVISFLVDRQPELETVLIRPRIADPDKGIHYWEVFERRRQLRRIREFIAVHGAELTPAVRLDLARTVLAHVATMHRLGTAHLDLGSHSVWMELPSNIRLSHLVAASYPDLKSLGDRRYEFLASGTSLPEYILGQSFDHFRKDVFLLAVVVHNIIFGSEPRSSKEGDPPDWDAAVDQDGRFECLHDWFAKSLDVAFAERFADAQQMLDAFNEASRTATGGANAVERLQRFRRWKSMLDLYREFPPTQTLKETDRVVVWRSQAGEKKYLVKTWRRSCWGEEHLEAPRLLKFCESAEDLILSAPSGLVRLLDVGYLSDHLVLVQEFVDATNLQDAVGTNSSEWSDGVHAVGFLSRLAMTVRNLHEGGRSHGDLKPTNVLVRKDASGLTPILVDTLDFGPAQEGEIHTAAYSPRSGSGSRERDRYAVLKITEELLGMAVLNDSALRIVSDAIRTCRETPPTLSTLEPLIEALEQVLNPREPTSRRKLLVRTPGIQAGPIIQDEGRYYVWVQNPTRVTLTGATEELTLTLHRSGAKVREITRALVEQSKVALAEKRASMSVEDEIVIEPGEIADFAALNELLQAGPVQHRLAELTKSRVGDQQVVVLAEQRPETSLEEDAIPVGEPELPASIDISALWRTLIDVEQEQFTEGVADSDSYYSRDRRRHLVAFLGRKGTIDFAREDKVIVELAHKKKGWIPIGVLDHDLTRSEMLAIDASTYRAADGSQLCVAGAELRFRSLMETDSRSRRNSATSRILSRKSVIPGLVQYFDPRAALEPGEYANSVNRDVVRERYDLNMSQAEAFVRLWSKRPLGLLQGPPGTGKTKFIAALVHHALSTGVVRNVLLASQSHEAVNNAAESVLKLFRKGGEEPSLVRVGQEGSVSEALKPYHSEKVEAHYREQFRARLKHRFRVAGRHLGIPDTFSDMFFFMEATVWPIYMQLHSRLRAAEETPGESAPNRRILSLHETLRRLGQEVGIERSDSIDWTDPNAYDAAVDHVVRRHQVDTPEQVRKLRAVASLVRDWVGSVTSRRRSFEEFLANTRQIVCGTCVGLGRSSLGLASAGFDLVVVDEAARCTPSELAVPMQSGRWILLVGDHLQLEPFHEPVVIREAQRRLTIPTREVMRSDFERAFASQYGQLVGQTLRTQYRMLSTIGQVVSDVFYGGILEHGRTEPIIPADVCPDFLKKELIWVRTDHLGENAFQVPAETGTSLSNLTEANAVVDLLRRLDDHQPFVDWVSGLHEGQKPVGIICTYAEQRELIRRRLREVGISGTTLNACKIDTVDSYQGKENALVILSLVRNNTEGPIESGRRTIAQGYMARGNRINVALSRAMDRLVIVGAFDRWPKGSPLAQVATAVQKLELQQLAEFIEASGVTDDGRKGKRTSRKKRTLKRVKRTS